MPLWTMPAVVSALLGHLAACLDRRTRPRFWSVFFGLLLCREKRRTASAWFRADRIGHDFRRAYDALGSVGRRIGSLSPVLLTATGRVAGATGERAVFALDDTVTKRYGPCVEGAGVHRNRRPGRPPRPGYTGMSGSPWPALSGTGSGGPSACRSGPPC